VAQSEANKQKEKPKGYNMTSILQAVANPPKPAAPDEQCVYIDLPGETVQCWRRSDNLRVVKRRHRDVIFDLSLASGNSYSVETSEKTSEFYNTRENLLVKKATFKDGEKFVLWISRDFKGQLVLKKDGKAIGRYEPSVLDAQKYGADPKAKPEPMMIAIGKKPVEKSIIGQCTPEDPYGIANNHEAQQALFKAWLKDMPNHGTTIDYLRYAQQREVQTTETEYVVVTVAEAKEILPHVLAQLDKNQPVLDVPEKVFAPITAASVLTIASNKFGETLAQNAWKETAGYVQEHWKQFGKLRMNVYVEKAPLGKFRVVFKGRMLTRVAGQSAATAAGYAMKDATIRKPMGAPSSAWLDGGYGKTGSTGMGGAKRITITAAKNFKSGMKIQMIDTVIDLYGDADTVFGKEGSQDLSEFLGRAGVTVAKAGATAALGSIFASVITTMGVAAMGAASAPVWLVVAAIVGGFILAATIVDIVDDSLQIKERAAAAAR
jgi:hypothetical protein